MSYPAASTPDPSVHQAPGSALNQLAFTAQELEAIGQQLLAGFMRQVVLAIFGVVTGQNLGTLRALLSTWAQDLDSAAANVEALLENAAQGTAAALGTALADLITGYTNLLNALYGAESIASQILVSAIPTEIPQANISDLVTDLGNLLPTGTWNSFLSQANTALQTGGSDLTHLITGFAAIPIGNVTSLGGYLTNLAATGLYDASAGFGNLGASLLRNLNGTGQFDASQLINWAGVTAGSIQQAAVNGYNDLLTALYGAESVASQLVVSAIPTGIPNVNILGTIESGAADIGAALQGYVASVWEGLTGQVSGGSVTAAQVSSAAAQTAATANSAASIAQSIAANIAAQAISKDAYPDPSADATFDVRTLPSPPTTIPVTQTSSVIGLITTPHGGVKKSVCWLGQNTTDVDALYINIYSLDTTTGALSWVWSSPNLISDVDNSLTLNFCDLPDADDITTAQGDWWAVEMQTEGSGTYEVVGIADYWVPPNPNSYTSQPAATRTTLATVTFDAVGAGADKKNQATTTTSVSWSHTPTAGADVFVWANAQANGSSNTVSMTATYGGIPMTLLGSIQPGGQHGAILGLFHLADAPAGAQTVAVTATCAHAVTALVGNSVSYLGAGTIGTASTTQSVGSTFSQSATGVEQGLVIQGFGVNSVANYGIDSYDQTQRYSHSQANSTDTSLVFGDSATVGSVSFDTNYAGGVYWGGIAVVLQPAALSAPSTISDPTAATNLPWFAMCGIVGISEHAPTPVEFASPGSGQTYDVPDWMQAGDFFDIVICSDGGGGDSTDIGLGGGAGSWYAVTLEYGVDIPTSTKTFTVNVGSGGAPTPAFGSGPASNGSGCSVQITGYGTLSVAGGTGGASPGAYGESPGNETFNGATYYGGAQQNAQGSDYLSGAPGNTPGAGGSAAFGGGAAGGAGAPGLVVITAYQG